jgi:hypothetical protein
MSARSDEAKRLARCRTLLAVAAAKVAGLDDNHPQRAVMRRKLNATREKLRVQERIYEEGR